MNNLYKFNKRERTRVRSDIFAAYFDCRRHKRGTANAMRFEINLETELDNLYRTVITGNYSIGRSCAFIVYKPVQREIFAADFRDRVIHHYIIMKLEPIFERLFINDSYSCRKGKGTHYGVERLDKFIRSCSSNYKKDCYILKVDIQGFFMNIRKEVLLQKIIEIIDKHYKVFDKQLLKDLVTSVVMYNPVPGCIVRGSRDDWKGLPDSKSLFRTGGTVGIPIGNLTSQVFANLYLNAFDHYVKRELKQRYYARYVDDIVLVGPDKEGLKMASDKMRGYLEANLGLTLHPRKFYLQHYSKGVVFTGVVIKPYRKYVGKRIRRSMNRVFNNDYRAVFDEEDNRYQDNLNHWISSVNSYLGICKHYDTYRLREALCGKLSVAPLPIGFNESWCVGEIKE